MKNPAMAQFKAGFVAKTRDNYDKAVKKSQNRAFTHGRKNSKMEVGT